MNSTVTSWRRAALPGVLALGLLTGGAAWAATPALQAVSTVDLNRYQGRWYQIAYYPNTFQRQCVSNTTADYKVLSNGQVEVVNRCKKTDGTDSQAVGLARIKQPRFLGVPVAPGTPSKLEVRFAPNWLSWVPGVWANYWVIQLADDYRYAVVGEPNRRFLWILSRTPTLSAQDDATIRARLAQQGYDASRLQAEPQP